MSKQQPMTPAEPTPNNVSIPKWALVGLIFTLSISLLAVAFLLGRESREPVASQTQTQPPPKAAVATTELASEDSTTVKLKVNRPKPRPRTVPKRQPPRKMAVLKAPVVAAKPKPRPRIQKPPRAKAPVPKVRNTQSAPSNSSINAYFQKLDAITAATPSLDDPNGIATQLLQQSLNGDNSGMERLLKQTKSALRKIRAIKAPPSCAEHHRLTVSQMEQAVNLLGSVGDATQSLDIGSLNALSTTGHGLQAEAQKLQRLERELRAKANR